MRFNTLHPDIIVEIIKIRDFTHNNKDIKIRYITINDNGNDTYNTECEYLSKNKYFEKFHLINTSINQKYVNICNRNLIKYLRERFSSNYNNIKSSYNIILTLYSKDYYDTHYIEYIIISKYYNFLNILFHLQQKWKEWSCANYWDNYWDDIEIITYYIVNGLKSFPSFTIMSFKTIGAINNNSINIDTVKTYNHRFKLKHPSPFTIKRKYFI